VVLGWKRSREETLALVLELHREGRGRLAIADTLGVTDRYAARLLEQVRDGKKPARNPSVHAAESPPTCESNGYSHTRPNLLVPSHLAARQMYDRDLFSYDLAAALEPKP
jgi:hypothetical protein